MLRGVDGALAAAARGLALFPLPAGGRLPGPGWHHQATTDPGQVRAMLAAGNAGVACRASGPYGVVGLDLDGSAGIAAFQATSAAHGQPWPDTLTVSTPGSGRHLYFVLPAGLVVFSTSGTASPLGEGIDVRGPGRRRGGYLVAPGSTVPAGAYVLTRDAPVMALPAWLVETLGSAPRPLSCESRPRSIRHGG